MTLTERIEKIKKIIPQKYHNISFEDENFVKALEEVLLPTRNEKPLLIQGPGGCGKSLLYKIMEDTLDDCIPMASTGIAAVNLETSKHKPMTIHSSLHIDVNSFYEPTVDSKTLDTLKKYRTVLIDEISMVNANLLDYIFLHIMELKENEGKNIKVVLFGDPLQLPPVDKRDQDKALAEKMENAGYENINFFNSFFWQELEGDVINLSKIYRQNDTIFTEVLNRIRETKETDYDIEFLNRNIEENNKRGHKGSVLQVYVTRKEVEEVNQSRLKLLKEKSPSHHIFAAAERPYKDKDGNELSVFEGKTNISLIPDDDDFFEKIDIYIGERVMCTRNETMTLSFCNGTIGTVVGFGKESCLIKTDSGKIISVTPVIYQKYYDIDNEVHCVRMAQVPLKPAYAITFHKCQGLTLDAVKLNFTGNIWFDSLTYVGLSRVKSLTNLYTNRPIRREDLHADSEALKFWQNHTATASSL